ncbi:Glu/Leu/Phe/Val family dehydrogenase [Marinobacterium arenosum]|uniref:Glu/Leu/Phe/Val family dehydrogenase n=1 Tax=Marinobacterium arenosum TaxID=2862496 RepID=UPI001C958A3D|nr:Glu/Leu/Phe/Val dehydrogenase [Marinobacterium arenosum]MBY4675221.1 Glu/Leu/Phe/Val dehydrogenase [Marinobacterium arenosum]
MADIFDFMDSLGPTKIIHIHEPALGLKAVLVVDNVAAGPAIGGLRMAPDVSTAECVRLARAMTLKNAAAGLPHGGAKSVLYGDPQMPAEHKELLIRELACALKDIRDYIFGPDMGTDETCMAWIQDEGGRSVGLPRALGGIPLDEIGATGWGLSHAVEVAAGYCDLDLQGARLAVQGFGAVGKHLARFLIDKGVVLVAVSDSRGGIHNAAGLDLDQLLTLKASGRSVTDYSGGQPLTNDAMIGVECDIWVPAARPDVVHQDNVDQLKARLVVEGANIPITEQAERTLHQRNVLVVPDYIANAGGVICGAMEFVHMSQAMALQVIEQKVATNTDQVLKLAIEGKIRPRQAALELATERVQAAMATRRWGLF